ncbi:hypothetical protein BDZ94DRAFT_1327594 [Collybia nuda]|uniref:DUF6533 domain-containing protein n=1 Tax=Collybia nuda TaxID=64659 RepID=A0A9P6CAU3_9AGAR|nr:hypothetical protein BDZ94DRAFT_1327594 [Collybia nuda]
MEPNFPLFSQATAERDAFAACATIIVFEYFLHFSSEVDLFWKSPWTLSKCLFLWSRYYSLLFNVLVLISLPLTSFDYLRRSTAVFILELRLYAMYGKPRWILYLFVVVIFGECAGMIAIFAFRDSVSLGINDPTPGLHVCADAKRVFSGLHWYVYYWVSVLVIEGMLLLLALWKAWTHRPVPITTPGSLMQRLTKGSVNYFLTIFWIYLINVIFYARHLDTLDEIGAAFAYALSCILANRLLIDIRIEAYGDWFTTPTVTTAIEFNPPSVTASTQSSKSGETNTEIDSILPAQP